MVARLRDNSWQRDIITAAKGCFSPRQQADAARAAACRTVVGANIGSGWNGSTSVHNAATQWTALQPQDCVSWDQTKISAAHYCCTNLRRISARTLGSSIRVLRRRLSSQTIKALVTSMKAPTKIPAFKAPIPRYLKQQLCTYVIPLRNLATVGVTFTMQYFGCICICFETSTTEVPAGKHASVHQLSGLP